MLAIKEKLVIIEPMNTKQGKRVGRPRGPEKVLFRARVTREEGSALGVLLENMKKGTEWSMRAVPLDSRASGDGVRVKDGVSGDFVLNSKGKLDAVVLEQAARIEELERLLSEARSRAMEPQGEEGVYWKMKYLEAKRRVEELERMGEG